MGRARRAPDRVDWAAPQTDAEGRYIGRAAAEHNAIAWLSMTDDDLVRCSASLGGDANLVPAADRYLLDPASYVHDPGAILATDDHVAELRAAADRAAADHAGPEFVEVWLDENPDRIDRRFQVEEPPPHVAPPPPRSIAPVATPPRRRGRP